MSGLEVRVESRLETAVVAVEATSTPAVFLLSTSRSFSFLRSRWSRFALPNLASPPLASPPRGLPECHPPGYT